MDFKGTSGADTLTGTSGNDKFNVTQGGNDTVNGLGGDDIINFGATLNSSDSVDGGSGNDSVLIAGDYATTALSLDADMIVNVETLTLGAGFDYTILENNAVAAGQTMAFNGSRLGANDTFTFNGSAEADATLYVTGGAGNDSFLMGAALTAADRIEGGGGSDQLSLNGDYNLVFENRTIRDIDTMFLDGDGNNYKIVLNEHSIAPGGLLSMYAYAISSGSVDINASHVRDGSLGIECGTGQMTITGGGGNDEFLMMNLTTADRLNGGTGDDTVQFFDGGVTVNLAPTTLTNIDKIVFASPQGGDFHIVSDGNVAAGKTMTLDASAMGPKQTLYLDFSSEAVGSLLFETGRTQATLIGGQQNDTFDFVHSGALTATDHIDGGAGNDTIVFDATFTGARALVMNSTTVTNVETFDFKAKFSYDVTLDAATIKNGGALTVDASDLHSTDTLAFDAHAAGGATSIAFIAGAGVETLGLSTNGGSATLQYGAVSDSTSTTYDTVVNVDFGHVTFALAMGDPSAIDTAVTTGALSTASFDSDLAAAVGSGQLAAHHAVLFTADSGTLSGHTFLVVDENGTAGYQASADLVIDVTGATGTLTTANFS